MGNRLSNCQDFYKDDLKDEQQVTRNEIQMPPNCCDLYDKDEITDKREDSVEASR